MSLWTCPEHGLYGGDVFCPKCGKNGAWTTIEDTMTDSTVTPGMIEAGNAALIDGGEIDVRAIYLAMSAAREPVAAQTGEGDMSSTIDTVKST